MRLSSVQQGKLRVEATMMVNRVGVSSISLKTLQNSERTLAL